MAIVAIIIFALALIAVNAYIFVNAYKCEKNPKEWAEFLDDAGVKRD